MVNSDQIVAAPSLFNSTVHIVTGLNENADLDEWTTFDDHGRPAKKWAPLKNNNCDGLFSFWLMLHYRVDKR